MQVSVAWGSEKLEVECHADEPILKFMEMLEKKTGVPVSRQKLMMRRRQIHSSDDWTSFDIKPQSRFMLIGTAEKPPEMNNNFEKEDNDQLIEDDDAIPAYINKGLKNYGNTCYLNSVLQVMRLIPEISQILKTANPSPESEKGAVVIQLKKFFEKFPENLNALVESIRNSNVSFNERDQSNNFVQQDAAECWGYLMNCMSQAVGNKISDLFHIEFETTTQRIRIEEENHENNKEKIENEEEKLKKLLEKFKNDDIEYDMRKVKEEKEEREKEEKEKEEREKEEKEKDEKDESKEDENKADENKAGENKEDENKEDENKEDENKEDENKSDKNKADENKADENKADENKEERDQKAEINNVAKEESYEPKFGNTEDDRLRCFIDQETKHIEQGIKAVSEVEKIDSKETIIYSEKKLISSLPKYLTIQMMRFCYKTDEETAAKIVRMVEHPMRLDTLQWLAPKLRKEFVKRREEHKEENAGYYNLKAIITHRGRSADSGHYISFVRVSDKWFQFDDEKVEDVEDEKILTMNGGADWHCSYMLIYEAI